MSDPREWRALTVRQPWCSAIVELGKDRENRTQAWAYRGRVMFHAGAAYSTRGLADPRIREAVQLRRRDLDALPMWVEERLRVTDPAVRERFPTRAILGVGVVDDVHPDAGCCQPWGESSYVQADGRMRTIIYHLVLTDIVRLQEPVLAPIGRLGLWKPPAELVEAVEVELERVEA